uniref:MRG domain-containing protein n=1 Tax=Glossina palpalis gambiensis TaxID=67801 RepID=A0A1B0B4R6_9MUSC
MIVEGIGGGSAFNLGANISKTIVISKSEKARDKSSGVHDMANNINSIVVPVLAPAGLLLPPPPPPPPVKIPVQSTKPLPISLMNTAPSLMRSENNIFGSSAEDLEFWSLTKMEIKIKMPNELKERLADDWEAINEKSKLLNIPSRITAQDVVDQYIASKSSRKSLRPSKDTIIAEVMKGIIEHFNVMLGTNILYKFEKQQYLEIIQKYPNTPVSQLYGAIHLLRLLANLDSVLTLSILDQQHINTILKYLRDFLKFLVRNRSIYFSQSTTLPSSSRKHSAITYGDPSDMTNGDNGDYLKIDGKAENPQPTTWTTCPNRIKSSSSSW